ncbi:Hypothetical predicted protein [Olea europaea subsp. europaea]|uniref:Uncharacterized protein n=1 Tax=Olea europaea subsp. europaea TaxID=158383 RepID=A0A8S0SWN5_OLEEU|nr:Hypothetical predicted protein [Olea europaea subsp. europaea]
MAKKSMYMETWVLESANTPFSDKPAEKPRKMGVPPGSIPVPRRGDIKRRIFKSFVQKLKKLNFVKAFSP